MQYLYMILNFMIFFKKNERIHIYRSWKIELTLALQRKDYQITVVKLNC
jgi:hypothetical protein